MSCTPPVAVIKIFTVLYNLYSRNLLLLFHVYATNYMVPYLTNVIGQFIGYQPPIPCIPHKEITD